MIFHSRSYLSGIIWSVSGINIYAQKNEFDPLLRCENMNEVWILYDFETMDER
jgi:hypothetical protein